MHADFLTRCLTLAEKARGKTGINPMVGAVLVRDGSVIVEGFHAEYGKAHAELQLLEKFDQKISTNDTLYVNLEPCCHEEKKTPPCAQLIVEKGVKNVVIGMIDPNPKVSGKGIEYLRSKGVTVTLAHDMVADCTRFNRGFVSLQIKGRPWITLKEARTSDGKNSAPDGPSLKITDAEQDAWSHRSLRARHDAILVGIGTVLRDDPQLTVRFTSPTLTPQPPLPRGEGAMELKDPWRVILDSDLQIPLSAKVVRKGTIVVASSPDKTKMNELTQKGVIVLHVPQKKKVFDWDALWSALTAPTSGFHGIASILVEGGPTTWEIFQEAKMVDEEVTLIG